MDLMKIPRISYVLYQKNSTSHATLPSCPIPSLLPAQHSCRLYDTQLSAGAHTILK